LDKDVAPTLVGLRVLEMETAARCPVVAFDTTLFFAIFRSRGVTPPQALEGLLGRV